MPSVENTVTGQESESNGPGALASYECSERWSQLIRAHKYQPVVEEVISQEWPKYLKDHALGGENRLTHTNECIRILASGPEMFAAAVQGDLLQRVKWDKKLQNYQENMRKRADNKPAITIQLLADENGIAPTPNQYNVIMGEVLEYLVTGSHENAWKIDNISGESVPKTSSEAGYRKYYQPGEGRAKENNAVKHLFPGMTQRDRETPLNLRDTPLKFPQGECRYSKNSHARLGQQLRRHSSNHAMNLVESICTHLHKEGKFKQHFRMHPFIIYLILEPKEVAVAEIFCSGLLQSWIQNGGGFNYHPHGHKMSS